MSLIIIGGTNTLLSFIGKDVICKTISNTCSSILVLINYLLYSANNSIGIKDKLEVLDLHTKINIVTLIVEENIEKYNDKKSINLIFNYINEILSKLREELECLKNKIIKHNNLYFSNFRKIDLTINYNNILSLNTILDNRFNLLIKTIKI
tara:strand:- start:229 stop:681 length:453 start_codon:yes stop_codon:yes gene_type:complete